MDTECGPKYRTCELVLTCPGYGYSPRGTVKVANMPYYKTPPNTLFSTGTVFACSLVFTTFVYLYVWVTCLLQRVREEQRAIQVVRLGTGTFTCTTTSLVLYY